ncbi:MAG: hypothetical protein MI922_08560, partial [Bacteroidales bacterium]|nr:hypothetical protein [Bacteroidales bacterium]
PIRTVRHHNVLIEDYFQPYRPEGVEFVDHRDDMRRRGWTYFKVQGHIAGKRIEGRGRVPFVYAKLRQQQPWLRFTIGDDTQIIDTVKGASLTVGDVSTKYPSGTFFQGLLRPWQGLHVMDTVRRDAALAELPFTTERLAESQHVAIRVSQGQTTLVYTIDLEQDLLMGIEVLKQGEQQGMLRFEFLQDLASTRGFTQPSPQRGQQADVNDSNKTMAWIVNTLLSIEQ